MKKSDGSGREAAVVQAFAYTKYLGKIRSVKIRVHQKFEKYYSGSPLTTLGT